MTFFSVTDACRRLGIDAKTLRRWLMEAQLPLQPHPRDGRKKGVSGEHLQLLAQLHQRRLTPLPCEPPEKAPDGLPSLPASLLALPETICALQAQITALQASVADLTSLLTSQLQQPARTFASPKPSKVARQPAKPASPVPHTRSAASSSAKALRKPVHVIPRVEYGNEGRYVVICPKRGVPPFDPDTSEGFAWVADQTSFRFSAQQGPFSAHHEWHAAQGPGRRHRRTAT